MATIVVAEDQDHIRHVLTLWLGKHGHDVVQAANGRTALAALRAAPAELLIADVNMPELDGLDLTRAAFPACPSLRHVFIVTSRCDRHELLVQLGDPRVSMLSKPFSPSQLLLHVQRALAVRGSGPFPAECARRSTSFTPGDSQ